MASTAPPRYVIGVDGGTESIRAGVFDPRTGRPVAFAARPYETSYPQPGWAEQRPEDWWQALGGAVRDAVAAAGIDDPCGPQVAAMCVDTTCCTVVALGADGAPLRPALLWMDMRSARQAAAVAACGAPELRVNGGGLGPVSAEWMVPKSLWIKENEPRVYERAATICEYQDYLNWRLTGEMVASRNNVAIRWHCSDGPPRELLRRLGALELLDKWPRRVAELGERIGSGLTAEAAAHLGLREGLPVAQGGADAFIGCIGLGVIGPGSMALLTGSSHLHIGMAAGPMSGKGMFGSYASALLPGVHVVEGGQTSTGSIVAWLRRELLSGGGGGGGDGGGDGGGAGSSSASAPVPYEVLNAEAEMVPPGCEGLVCLDHLQGNRTPHTDPLSRGALVGLTLKHTRGHVFRAVMEGVAFGTEAVLRAMRAAGYSPKSLTVAGGATRSPLWLQIHADVSGLPLHLTEVADAPALGCAILAAVAAGVHPDVPSAVAAMVRVASTVLPDPSRREAYAALFARGYSRLYPALRPLFHDTAAAAAANADAADAAPDVVADMDAAAPATTTVPPPSPLPLPLEAPPPRVIVAPSILAADFASLGDEVSRVLAAGADWVHVDMFDGGDIAGGNLTIGPPVVAALRRRCPEGFLDVHLCVSDPRRHLPALADAGASSLTFQIEAFAADGGLEAAAAFAADVRRRGMRAAVAVAVDTPVEAALPLASSGAVDMLLVMAVRCGFGGQSFDEQGTVAKVRRARAACPTLQVQVDGGINRTTAAKAAAAGANVFVAGTAVFGAAEGIERAIAGIRSAALAELPAALVAAAAGAAANNKKGGGSVVEAAAV